ncbi:MAG: hypothetical protein AB1726_00715 [Planctomycetota bacterium]
MSRLLGLGLALLLAGAAAAQDSTPAPPRDRDSAAVQERPLARGLHRRAHARLEQRDERLGPERWIARRAACRMILQHCDGNRNGRLDPREVRRLVREINRGERGRAVGEDIRTRARDRRADGQGPCRRSV